MNTQTQKTNTAVQNRIFNGVLLGRSRIDREHNRVSIYCNDNNYKTWLMFSCSSFGPVEEDSRVRFTNSEKISGWLDRWTDRGYTVIPDNLTLTPKMAGVWYRHRGEVDSHDRVYLSIHPPKVNLERAKSVIEEAGFGCFISPVGRGGHVVVTEFDSEEFLDWIELPP